MPDAAGLEHHKNEVIYGLLSSDGIVRSLYAVNHFNFTKAGTFVDYGNYTCVINLTDTNKLKYEGDAVTLQAPAGDFYYQGNMAVADLPWQFQIGYRLDGEAVLAENLAGASGKLEIRISVKENDSVNAAFYEHYMLQISVMLDPQKCSAILAPEATIAEAGRNQLLTYTVMPGKDADYVILADVRDFEMAGIEISAVPFSMNISLPDMSGLMNQFGQLPEAVAQLNDGAGRLADGAAQLKQSAEALSGGSGEIAKGLVQLSGGTDEIIAGSVRIRDALLRVSESGNMDFSGLTQLTEALRQASEGLMALKDAYAQAFTALDRAVQNISDENISEDEIAGLYALTDPSQYALIEKLVDFYTASCAVKATYLQIKPVFDAAVSETAAIADAVYQIGVQSQGAADQLSQLPLLFSGLSQLSQQYNAFHDGLAAYASGVQQLAGRYPNFDKGLSLLTSGIGGLSDGADVLRRGTALLNDEVSKLPDTVQKEIDSLLSQYDGSDYTPVSFTSPKNPNTNLVQFVLKCDGISKAIQNENMAPPAGKESFWDRLKALFK